MPLPQNDESLLISRYKSSPVVGSLISMPTTTGLEKVDWFKRAYWFDFPSMPDVIELARSTDYSVNSAPNMPDGMHVYRSTKPLEIPLSFKLHAMDKLFCPYGSFTLLQLAARLHSFVLPMTMDGNTADTVSLNSGNYVKEANAEGDKTVTLASLGSPTESSTVYDSDAHTPVRKLSSKTGQSGYGYPPATCLLNLIYAGVKQPGICCIGYVRDVRVRLMGPWLRGNQGEFNLPSAGEFEFTFMHHPSHSNYGIQVTNGKYTSAPAILDTQAYAHDVRQLLYNTRSLVMLANYHGFSNDTTDATTTSKSTVDDDVGAESPKIKTNNIPVNPRKEIDYSTFDSRKSVA